MTKRILVFLISVIFIFCASTVEATSIPIIGNESRLGRLEPSTSKQKKKKKGRRAVVVVPHPPRPDELKPTREERIKQNKIADQLNYPIIWDDQVLKQMRLLPDKRTNPTLKSIDHQLISPHSTKCRIKSSSYTYPSVVKAIDNLCAKFSKEHKGKKLEFNSFVRTIQRQRSMTIPCLRYTKIRRGKYKGQLRCVRNPAYNPHAAAVEDPEAFSLHPRGTATDLSIKNLKTDEILWLRGELIALKKQDIGFYPIEEQRSGSSVYRINCFHLGIFDPVAYQALKESNKLKDAASSATSATATP